MRFGVLGPLEVLGGDNDLVDVGGRQPRMVLVALLASGDHPISPNALVEVLWGDDPPPSAVGTLQSYISRLRAVLDRSGGPSLLLDESGYRLAVDPAATDVGRFERLTSDGHAKLRDGMLLEAHDDLAAALALWRGPPFVELADRQTVVVDAAQLEERRHAALNARLDAALSLGRHHELVAELTAIVSDHPFDEAYHAKLAIALYRTGRQADALRSIAEAAHRQRDELGLEPGRVLLDLEVRILNHEPSLDLEWSTDSPPWTADRSGRLCGRRHELGRLLKAYDDAVIDAAFVVIEGDPGIGKTRLAEELQRIAVERGSIVLRGRSDESGAAPALWPWLPILRELTTDEDRPTSRISQVLSGDAPLLSGQGAAIRFEVFDEIGALLESAGSTAPVVVLLDDIQWADATTLQLLQFLAARPMTKVMILITVRSMQVGRRDRVSDTLAAIARRPCSERFVLTGLSAENTSELVRSVSTHFDGESVTARIHDRAEGNPFYVIELARLMGPTGEIDGELPPTIGDVVRRRITELTRPTLDLLELGAAAGREFDVAVVAAAARIDLRNCVELLDPALVQRILVSVAGEPGTLRFTHALVREVLLDGVTALRRAVLHLQLADAIEASDAGIDDAELVAEHLWRAAAVVDGPRAATALERAAEVAIRRVAYSTAEDLLGRAGRLRRSNGTDPTAELETLTRLLEVMQATRYFSGADRDVLDRAMTLAERLERQDTSRTLRWYEWSSLATAARAADGLPLADRFFDRWARDPRPEVRAGAYAVRGEAGWSVGNITEAAEHFDKALALLEGVGPPTDGFELESQLLIHTFSLWTHAAHGDRLYADVFAGFNDLLETWPPLASPSICGFAGSIAPILRKWDELDHFAEHALEADPAAQFAFWGGQMLMYRGLVAAHAGRIDDGMAWFIEGRTRYRSVGARTGLSSFEALMGELTIRAGATGDGAELLATARRRLERSRERWNESVVCIGEAVVAHHTNMGERAAERLDNAFWVATEQGAHALARRAEATAIELGYCLDVPEVDPVAAGAEAGT